MADQKFTLPGDGIANIKANQDRLVEFCHLAVLLLEVAKPKGLPIGKQVENIVNRVMKDPRPPTVMIGLGELNIHAESLPTDPRKQSTKLAESWRELKKLRDGQPKIRDLKRNTSPAAPGEVEIKVQVWNEGKTGRIPLKLETDKHHSEIHFAIPRVAAIGNAKNIIQYAAISGKCNVRLDNGRPQPPEKLKITPQAIYLTNSREDVISKNSKLYSIKNPSDLRLVNTTSKTTVVAIIVRAERRGLDGVLFDIKKPSQMLEIFETMIHRETLIEHFNSAKRTIAETRFLFVQTTAALAPAMPGSFPAPPSPLPVAMPSPAIPTDSPILQLTPQSQWVVVSQETGPLDELESSQWVAVPPARSHPQESFGQSMARADDQVTYPSIANRPIQSLISSSSTRLGPNLNPTTASLAAATTSSNPLSGSAIIATPPSSVHLKPAEKPGWFRRAVKNVTGW